MNLILSVDAIVPPLSGIGRYAWELARRYVADPGFGPVRFYLHGRWVSDPVHLLTPSQAGRAGRYPIKPPAWLRQGILRRACRGSVFHGPNYFLPACADIGVATVHDLSVFRFPEMHPAARVTQFEQEFARSLDRAVHLITDSEAIRQEVIDFCAWPAGRITAIPLGVGPSFVPRASAVASRALAMRGLVPDAYALCVATLEPRKRIDRLLTAYGRLPRRLLERYPLVLAGSPGWHDEGIRGAIDEAQREGWMRYLGFVAEAELPALYAGARAFLFPSMYEGFGLPVLEAMASGVPVLTSDRGAMKELAGNAALLVEPDDADALLRGIERVLTDQEWRSEARSQGLSIASGHTWERCVARTFEVCRYAADVGTGTHDIGATRQVTAIRAD